MRAITTAFFALFFFTASLAPVALNAADTKVLSVLYFNNTTLNKDYAWLSRGFPDMLTTGLSQAENVRVVDREDLQRVLNEQKLALAGLADEKSAVRVGKLLNANLLIRGSYIIQGDKVRVDARIIDTETGQLKSLEQTGSAADIFALVKDLTEKILLNVTLKAPTDLKIGTSSIDAAKYYYQGLEFLETTNVDKAIEKFNQSREKDPFYSRPQTGLEEAYKFLKDFRALRQQREINELFDKLAAYKSRMNEKPFRTYADILKDADFSKMTQDERDRFNQKNQVVMQTQSPANAAWMAMVTLLEITGKLYSVQSEKWNDIQARFSEREKEVRDRQNKETREIHNKKIGLTTNKTLSREELAKERDALDALSDEIDKKHDAEDKALDEEEKKIDDAEAAELKDLERRNFPYLSEMVTIAENARTAYKNDSFLPEILYMELLGFREMKDYLKLKSYSESFLMDYPKFRMIEAVEDFYKTALDKLKEGDKK